MVFWIFFERGLRGLRGFDGLTRINIRFMMIHEDLTREIIKIFYGVYNELGYGFLERVYQNAMFIELKNNGFDIEVQKKIQVFYKEHEVGWYIADIMVNNCVILELKAQDTLVKANESQLINYLKATECEVGLLLNFGKKPELIRKVYQNNFK